MSETLKLRRAVPGDAEAVRALTRQAYTKWVPLIGREPKPMLADYVAAIKIDRIDLAHVGETLAGLIETVAEPDHLLIENVAVSPAFQRRGIGRTLMAHAECLAATLGHGELRLYTNKRFTENVALYLKLGYRIDREEELPHGVVVHMAKRLGRGTTTIFRP
jgi:ribosomal protein S18 acetylase RimI-like enzyme